jgi:chaperone required for assembly of F1-ATPase
VTPSLKKRFWKNAEVANVGNGFVIELDGHVIRTPSKALLKVESHKIAEQIAFEWMAQKKVVNPATMPNTRMANSVIDKIMVNREAVIEMLAEYAGSDLLCYRATTPQGLINHQNEIWNPILNWSKNSLLAPMLTTSGVMHIKQSIKSISIYQDKLEEMNPYQLAGMHDLITISGSFVIPMALISNQLNVSDAWYAATVDERWQEKQWGIDDEAAEALETRRLDFEFAYKFWKNAT